MRLTERIKAAASAFRGKSASRETVELNALYDYLGLHGEDRSERSEATYFACLKVLGESIGKLPLKLQQYTPEHGIRVARGHRYYRMLNERPNRYMAAGVFWSTMELCRNHYGNAYAWIDSRDPGRPQLWPMDPAYVQVWYDDAGLLADSPDLYYRYATPRGNVVLGSEEVLHFKSHNTLDGLVGISVREQLASTIQGGAKAQKMLNKLFDSGLTAKSVLQYTGSLSDANVKTLLAGIEGYARGEMRNSGIENIIPIPVGYSLVPLNLKLADSQFLELRQYNALQITSAFGVKPYQVGDYTKSSYASAEAQQLSFLVDTLLYIVKQYEEEISYKLLTDDEVEEGYHTKFNVAVMLRADQQTQINTLSAAVSNFLMTPNEARERLDLPAKEGGDRLLGNGASIPVQYTGAQYINTPGKEE
ncbi:MAG: phage portal protein [Butyricicoccus sp.]|nr:phage portal protein [Butyricicoccus sp.]